MNRTHLRKLAPLLLALGGCAQVPVAELPAPTHAVRVTVLTPEGSVPVTVSKTPSKIWQRTQAGATIGAAPGAIATVAGMGTPVSWLGMAATLIGGAGGAVTGAAVGLVEDSQSGRSEAQRATEAAIKRVDSGRMLAARHAALGDCVRAELAKDGVRTTDVRRSEGALDIEWASIDMEPSPGADAGGWYAVVASARFQYRVAGSQARQRNFYSIRSHFRPLDEWLRDEGSPIKAELESSCAQVATGVLSAIEPERWKRLQ